MVSPSGVKRRRIEDPTMTKNDDNLSLTAMLELGFWDRALDLVRRDPSLVSLSSDPCPLAIACRHGVPYECVRTILSIAPEHVRRVLDSRGTPLHEAIVCENIGAKVIELLLQTDEELGKDATPATLLQDVDGFTPLHLLIRRRFQAYMLKSDEEDTSLMQILEMLVSRCPDAVVMPDLGEYEEPPIVYAIKANIYAPSLGSEDSTIARVERQIFEMVKCMLKYNPSAASRVFTGYRGQYTALHSAVFHGRYTDTIELILSAEAQTVVSPTSPKASLLQNTQGEIPLHFCAMRGERPRSVELIARAAPKGVLKRDTSGMTPFHWLWIRFISTLLTLEEGGRGTDATISIPLGRIVTAGANMYNEFALLEQGSFNADLHLFKRMDPPLDFLRMRHIPVQVLENEECLERASRAAAVLSRIRARYYQHTAAIQQQDDDEEVEFSREEVVIALFWTKVVSLLQAANQASPKPLSGDSILLHTAFASKSCLSPVAHLVSAVFPQELMIQDDQGHLPLHCAASRPWEQWDWPASGSLSESTPATKLLQFDSLKAFQVALALSPPEAVQVADHENRLVLHHLIDTLVAASASCRHRAPEIEERILGVLRQVVSLYPDALQHVDGSEATGQLYPFLQATATATVMISGESDELSVSITYMLLRENPTLLFKTFR